MDQFLAVDRHCDWLFGFFASIIANIRWDQTQRSSSFETRGGQSSLNLPSNPPVTIDCRDKDDR
jgi:hypothetical protein